MRFNSFISYNNFFSLLCLITFILGIIPFILYNKGEIVLSINANIANSTLDFFFKHFTRLGHGSFFIFIILIMSLFSYRHTATLILIGVFILATSFLLKHVIFSEAQRPIAYFSYETFVHLIPNYYYEAKYSFPSGHTMVAFGLMSFFASLSSKKILHIIFFLTAFSIAFSRMYLLKHFYADVYVGFILGFLITQTSLYFSQKHFIGIDTKTGLIKTVAKKIL